MKIKNVFVIVLVLIIGKYTIDYFFKIKYSSKEIYEINNFVLNDSLEVTKGKIMIGANSRGKLEAIILPDSILKFDSNSTIEYVYIRFYPEWFNKKINPCISRIKIPDTREKLLIAKALHDSNFRNYMHLNDYPIIKEYFVPYVLKIKESGAKIRLEYNQ